MLKLTVNAKSPAAITSALRQIKEMTSTGTAEKDTEVHLILEGGTYCETIRYNLSNPLLIESAPGISSDDCVIQADNCEAYNKGQSNRAIFLFGPNVTSVKMRNFTIENTHLKTSQEVSSTEDIAETLVWQNTSGSLFCEGMQIKGRQNTLYVKGYARFLNSYISGDVDFICGEPDCCLFENCKIDVIEDNRGDIPGFAVNCHAPKEKTGFIFLDCHFTGEKRKKSPIFACRTDGKGSRESDKNWDSIAFINCIFSDIFNPALIWDDDMNLDVYPRGNAKFGVREYKSKTEDKNEKLTEADTSERNVKSYTLTDDDYFAGYASRFLILRGTPLQEQ